MDYLKAHITFAMLLKCCNVIKNLGNICVSVPVQYHWLYELQKYHNGCILILTIVCPRFADLVHAPKTDRVHLYVCKPVIPHYLFQILPIRWCCKRFYIYYFKVEVDYLDGTGKGMLGSRLTVFFKNIKRGFIDISL